MPASAPDKSNELAVLSKSLIVVTAVVFSLTSILPDTIVKEFALKSIVSASSTTVTVKLKDVPLAAPTVVTVPLLLLASTVKL